MSRPDSVLFIDYATTVKLLPVPDAMAICEDVFRMHARNSVKWSVPPSQKLDVGAPFHNHWHVKTVILEDEPIAGVRLYEAARAIPLDMAEMLELATALEGHPDNAAASMLGSELDVTQTRQSSASSDSATARPSPRLAAVTMARLPRRPSSMTRC